ncbi:IPT/TIG domain-containing protein [Ottowia thiooxydans]|uniref:IPT/TIG domain-containing protein n=1 Tax=Ottowia thiooxydans TaxID=219182 RepID=A0ABV2Q7B0_9BURK
MHLLNTRYRAFVPAVTLMALLGFSTGAAASSCVSINGTQQVISYGPLTGTTTSPLFSGSEFNPGDLVNLSWTLSSVSLAPSLTLNWGDGMSDSLNGSTISHSANSSTLNTLVSITSSAPGPGTYTFSVGCQLALSTVSAVTPGTGVANDVLTINGTGFFGASQVFFGDTPATPTIISSTQMSVTVPAGSGIVPLKLVNAQGVETPAGFNFQYLIPPLILDSAAVPPAAVGEPYIHALSASGGVGPYSYSATGLPSSGLSMNPQGVITGTPSSAGNLDIEVTVTDSQSAVDTRSFSLQINASAPALAFTSVPPANVRVGSAPYIVTTNSDQSARLSLSVDSGSQSVCTIQGQAVNFVGAGSCVIRAMLAAQGSLAEESVQQQVQVEQAATPSLHGVPGLSPWGLAALASALVAVMGLRRQRRHTA